MTYSDTKTLLNKIKSNYQNFYMNEFVVNEWHEELKDYSYEDVLKALDKHFRSEIYGEAIPKAYNLTRHLLKEDEKGRQGIYYVKCQNCGAELQFTDYTTHIDKCNKIQYLKYQALKYNLVLNEPQKLYLISDEQLDNLYDKVLLYVLKNTKDEHERERINKIINHQNVEVEQTWIKKV